MSGLIRRIGVVLLLLVFVSACFQPPPTPEQTPEPPTDSETPLLGDTDIDGATDDLGTAESIEGDTDDSAGINLDTESAIEPPSTEITAQAVLPGGKGFVVYVWNTSASATTPWRIYRHNAATDVTTLVYGGLRQISSVAINGDGNTLLVSMKETTDPASDYEIYQIALSPQSVTQLTSNTGEDSNVSMSGSAGLYVWEGDSTNAGLRNVFLRTNTVTPATTTALAPTLSSTQPSITNDGRYIALMRRSTTNNNYLIYVYNRTTNVYTLRVSSGSVIEHPSVSNYAEKVAWLMKVSATSNRIYTRDLLAPSTTPSTIVINTASVLDHPHLSADGNYLTYAQQVSGRFVVYNRNLTTNQQVLPVSTTASLTAPYWQQAAPVTQLVGSAGSLATAAIPRVEYKPRDRDFALGHPQLSSLPISFNTLLMTFQLATTVQEANTILSGIGAEIIGGLPGTTGQSTGILAVRLPTITHEAMTTAINNLRANPKVKTAVQDALLGDTALPQPHNGDPNTGGAGSNVWRWDNPASGGNYGLKLIRAPQMWNLNATLIKQVNVVPNVNVGVLDGGVAASHPDLAFTNLTPANATIPTGFGAINHGTQTSGIIGATFNNNANNQGIGIDGVSPFANLGVYARQVSNYVIAPGDPIASNIATATSLGTAVINSLYGLLTSSYSPKIVNISQGYNWYSLPSPNLGVAVVNPMTNVAAQEVVQNHADILVTGLIILGKRGESGPLFVVAAGNDSDDGIAANNRPGWGVIDATWGSPFAYAGITMNEINFLVVEAIDSASTRAVFSNVSAHIFAPGVCIWSTTNQILDNLGNSIDNGCGVGIGRYIAASGTSFATPHVSGLASYLLRIEPRLSNQNLRDLIVNNGRTVTAPLGVTPRPYIDAYASALAIDQVRGNTRVLKMLLDIDDGTLDGNQRTLISSANTSGTTDANQDGVVDAALSNGQPFTITTTDFGSITATEVIGEDVDGDTGVGDGTIDMSDFRRWRDWYLQTNSLGGALNGSANYYKKDVNSHPTPGIAPQVEPVSNEGTFPRGDFNGDGRLGDNQVLAAFPKFDSPQKSDLQVLKESGLWSDSLYTTANLDSLLTSGDLEIWVQDLYTVPTVTTVQSYIEGDVLTGFVTHTPANPRFVYTLVPGTYVARIGGLDSSGNLVVGLKKTFTVTGNGDDQIWAPLVSLVSAPVTLYNGPNDDCQRLQGEYGVDIRGLWDGAAPIIDINKPMGMFLNTSVFNVIEREKLTNWPLTVRAKSLRHCNASEGQKFMALAMNYDYSNAVAPIGFYIKMGDNITIQDNRWPGKIWNLTNASTSGQTCTGTPVNFTIVSNYPGEANQVLNDVPVGASRDILMRSFAAYNVTVKETTSNFQFTVQTAPPNQIDAKTNFQGVAAWFHAPLRRLSGDSQCQTNLFAGASTPSLSASQPNVFIETLFTPSVTTEGDFIAPNF